MRKEKIISTTNIPDEGFSTLENLEALKVEKLTPEQIIEKWTDGGYNSVASFEKDFKDQYDMKRHQLRTFLIGKGVFTPKKRGVKTEEPGEPKISSKEFYRLFFNEFLGKEINTSIIPQGCKKWLYSEDELILLGSVTDPILPKIELPEKIQNWIRFGIVMFTLVIPRFTAQLKENKETKNARSPQKPKSD